MNIFAHVTRCFHTHFCYLPLQVCAETKPEQAIDGEEPLVLVGFFQWRVEMEHCEKTEAVRDPDG